MRWMNISLRTVHLIGVAGVGGAFLYQVQVTEWKPYLLLLGISGFAMFLLELKSNIHCALQIRGIVTIVKIALLLMTFYIGMQAYILISIIVLSGVVSHAPGKVRYFHLFKGSAH
jgi:hypothetical protein